jgi:hypothetical protein
VKADVASSAEVKTVFAGVAQRFERLDILVRPGTCPSGVSVYNVADDEPTTWRSFVC